MSGGGTTVVVKRGVIQGHVPPPGGDFARRAIIPARLTGLVARYLGVHCVDTDDRVLALTYDDGPHPEHTPLILDTLAEHGVSATFFVLAEPSQQHPDVIRRIVADGHEVALHGADHRSMLGMGDREAIDSVLRARDVVESIGGVPVRLFRPPYGHHTPGQAARARRAGLELVIWSSDGLDWIDDTAERIAQRAWRSVFPGGILLLHDDRADPETLRDGEQLPGFDKADVARRILHAADREDYAVMRVGELLERYPHVLSASRERMRRR